MTAKVEASGTGRFSQAATSLAQKRARARVMRLIGLSLLAAALPVSRSGAETVTSITVVADNNYPPYIFEDHTGRLVGLVPDVWKLWEEQTGVQVDVVAMDWLKAQQFMQQGRADVLDTVFSNQSRSLMYDFSKPYAEIEVPVFFDKDLGGIADLDSLHGFTIGVKAGDACIEVLKAQGITELAEYDSYEDIVRAATGRHIRVFSIDKPPALYHLYKNNVAQNYRQAFTLYTGTFYRAVHKGHADLLRLVEEGFAAIPAADIRAIETRWMGTPFIPPAFVAYFQHGLLIVLAAFLVLIIFNLMLRRRVKVKAAELGSLFALQRESEASYRGLFDAVKEAIYIQDENGVFLAVNQGAEDMYGYPREEFKGKTPEFLAAPGRNNLPAIQDLMARAFAGEPQQFEFWGRRRNGDIFPKDVRLSRGTYFGRTVIIALAFDITERKEAETELRVSHDYMAAVFDSIHDALFVVNAATKRIITVNQRACDMFGYAREEILQLDIGQLSLGAPPYSQVEAAIFLQKTRDDGPQTMEWIARHRNGQTFWTEINARYALVDQYERFLVSVRDITDRKRAAETLQLREVYLQALINNFPFMVWLKNEEGRFLAVNQTFAVACGRKDAREVVGLTDLDVWPRELAEKYRADDRVVLKDGRQQSIEEPIADQGTVKWFETFKTPIFNSEGKMVGTAGFSRDITERKQAEEDRIKLERQIQQAQKLESLGVLAGGIAHDFNNLLTAILGNIDLALSQMSPAAPAREDLIAAETATRRAAELAKQMLAYSGKGRFVLQQLDLREVVNEMAHMLQVSISKKAQLRLNFEEDLPAIHADPTQLRQVIMNLVINASEAIGDHNGVIALSVGVMTCDRNYLAATWHQNHLPDGRYVFLEVEDTGCGIAPEQRAKIFDPFFSTKFTGRGLGLAAVMGIVRSHNSAIKVDSEPGRGTTFRVLFPASEAPAKSAACPEAAASSWRGTGLVLLVDDEASICATGRKMLEHLGFAVLTAADGGEGLQLFRQHARDIVCVLLDLTMPNMDGEETFRELLRIDPRARVILCSGYSEQDVLRRFNGQSPAGIIQKPYTLDHLRQHLERILRPPDPDR